MLVALFSYNRGSAGQTVAEGVKQNGQGGQTQCLPFFSGWVNQLDPFFWSSNPPQRHSFPSQWQRTRFRPVILYSQDNFIPFLHVLITISFPLYLQLHLRPWQALEWPRMTSPGCSSSQEGQPHCERISRYMTDGWPASSTQVARREWSIKFHRL